jgi:2'-5' RNA ligase
MEVIRAFLALDLPSDIKARLMELESAVNMSGADVKLVENENLHVTLKFLGDINPEMIEKVYDVMNAIKEPSFVIEVKGSGVFPNQKMPRVLWAGVAEGSVKVTSIFRQLESGLTKLGCPAERNFTPHITVGRVRSLRNRDRLLQVLANFNAQSFGETRIDRIVLKKSVLSSAGPTYTNVKEAPLTG